MLDHLYEMATAKKPFFDSAIELMKLPTVPVAEHWFDLEIQEDHSDLTIAAGDGSLNRIKYLPFIFYAVSAVGLIFTGEPIQKVSKSEMDIMAHNRHAGDKLRNKMGIFEIQTAVKILKEHDVDYFLFDGSILGDIIRPFPKDSEGQKENLGAVAELMEYRDKLVAISKTSMSKEFFREEIPDIAVFEEYSRLEGHSRYHHVSLADSKREFPYRNVYFKNLVFTVFYARLADYKNLLKFELPYKANLGDIRRTLSAVKSISAEGYPLLLKMAHNEVIIKKSDIEGLSRIVGFVEKRGREML